MQIRNINDFSEDKKYDIIHSKLIYGWRQGETT
jgi:hypothetical protein